MTRPRYPVHLSQAMSDLTNQQIMDLGMSYVQSDNLEMASYVHDYLSWLPDRKHADELRVTMCDILGMDPVPFLAQAHQITQWFRSRSAGKYSVYIILLDGFEKTRYGLYVGQTSNPISVRFDQHLSGGKLAARCHRKMNRLLPTLFSHFNPMEKQDSLDLERSLINQFLDAGIKTKGG